MAARNNAKGFFSPRWRQGLALAAMLCSLLLFLSILSYSSEDQQIADLGLRNLLRTFSSSAPVTEPKEAPGNLIGVFGALVASWFINSTIGYASMLFPLLGFGWGYKFLRDTEKRALAIATNYLLAFGLLFSVICGVLRRADLVSLNSEWSGVAGTFIAMQMSLLVGVLGALLILFGLTLILVFFAFEIDIAEVARGGESAAGALSQFFRGMIGKFRRIPRDDETLPEDDDESGPEKQWSEESRSAVVKKASPVLIKKPDAEYTILPKAQKRSSSQPSILPDESIVENENEDGDEIEIVPAQKKPVVSPKQIERLGEEEEIPLAINEKAPEEEVDFDQREIEEVEEEIDYVFPSVELLDPSRSTEAVDDEELKANAELLRTKLSDFDVQIESVSVTPGPVVTLYEIVPATGVKISRIQNLEDDIALALKARGIRIIAPMPGKGTVGVEIPNHSPSLVTLRSIINSQKFHEYRGALPLALGKTISGEAFVDDLAKMPHLLIAGATGSGKSVGINTIITSLVYSLHPSDVKFVIIDPKKIELNQYAKLRAHYLCTSPDVDEEIITTAENAVYILKSVELEMENRYTRLASAGVRNISDYNTRLKEGKLQETKTIKHRKLPYIIIIIDELADLMITAAREVEEPIARLAQLARAVGIHLVVATQRPSVDVITGVIKANFPARIAYQVASKIDSRTILDMNGAEQLLGSGDMLYLPAGSPKPLRIQNAFITPDEVERVVTHVGKQKGYKKPMQLPSVVEKKRASGRTEGAAYDELFEEAARTIVRHQQGSVSLLQRRLKIGYSRAARLVDELEAAGIVGPFDGSKARLVLVETEEQLDRILDSIG
jgi:S-DNA-T family DNA segregation ATPase FtsK/SpoIIIE